VKRHLAAVMVCLISCGSPAVDAARVLPSNDCGITEGVPAELRGFSPGPHQLKTVFVLKEGAPKREVASMFAISPDVASQFNGIGNVNYDTDLFVYFGEKTTLRGASLCLLGAFFDPSHAAQWKVVEA
jgi:hypothetical protein